MLLWSKYHLSVRKLNIFFKSSDRNTALRSCVLLSSYYYNTVYQFDFIYAKEATKNYFMLCLCLGIYDKVYKQLPHVFNVFKNYLP